VEKNKMNLEEQAEITEDFVSGLLERMDLQARVVSSIEDNRAVVQAQGLNLGLAIGPRGETVRAITQLAHTMIQRLSDGEAEGKLTVDIGGYRERRRTFLAEFAVNQANEVIEEGNSVALDPMNASDRKVVHDAVSDIEGVTTRSEGSDYDRHVVITVDET
jgi:spoIIIJ-associated protein